MAISVINQSSASGATVVVPTGVQTGDYLLMFSHKASTTAPATPTGFTSADTYSGSQNSARAAYKVATGSESGTNVTSTNATSIAIVIYRGVASVGLTAKSSLASTTNQTIPAFTMSDTSGRGWVTELLSANETTSKGTPSNGHLRVTATGASDMFIVADSNAGVSSWSSATSSNGTSATGGYIQVELVAPANSAPTVALNTPTDTGTVSTTTPDLVFTGTDPDGDDIEYEVQVDTVNTFDSQSGYTSQQSQLNIGSNEAIHGTGGASNQAGLGQSFVASSSYSVSKIELWGCKFGSPTDNLKIEILTGSMTGTVIGTSNNVAGSSLSPYSTFAIVAFTFSSPASLTSGTTYYLRITRSGTYDGSNYYFFQASSSSTGAYVESSTGTWTLANSPTAGMYYNNYSFGTVPLLDKLSATPDATFTDVTNGADTHPFASGDQVKYTIQAGDALTDGSTYYWRVRASDPAGTNTYGSWATTQSFTVSTGGGGGGTTNSNFFGLF